MKPITLSALLALSIVSTASASPAQGPTGEGVHGGGDPRILRNIRRNTLRSAAVSKRMDEIEKLLSSDTFRLILMARINHVIATLDQVEDPSIQEKLRQIRVDRFFDDIERSEYVFKRSKSETCHNSQGDAVPAGSRLGDFSGEICIQLRELAEMETNDTELIALLLHEHSQHLGIEDSDHRLMLHYDSVPALANSILHSIDQEKGSVNLLKNGKVTLRVTLPARYHAVVREISAKSDVDSVSVIWPGLESSMDPGGSTQEFVIADHPGDLPSPEMYGYEVSIYPKGNWRGNRGGYQLKVEIFQGGELIKTYESGMVTHYTASKRFFLTGFVRR